MKNRVVWPGPNIYLQWFSVHFRSSVCLKAVKLQIVAAVKLLLLYIVAELNVSRHNYEVSESKDDG